MYSYTIPEDKKDMYAMARAEDVEASYKDLAEVCGRIRNKDCNKAVAFLELAAAGDIPVLFKRHNKRLAHRRELGGAKGRYPMKAAKAVLKALNSAIANSRVKGLGEGLIIVHACANKLHEYPRMSPKGRRFRQDYSTSRIEIVVKEKVELPSDERKRRRDAVKARQKPAEQKPEGKKETAGAEEKKAEPHKHEGKSETPKTSGTAGTTEKKVDVAGTDAEVKKETTPEKKAEEKKPHANIRDMNAQHAQKETRSRKQL